MGLPGLTGSDDKLSMLTVGVLEEAWGGEEMGREDGTVPLCFRYL